MAKLISRVGPWDIMYEEWDFFDDMKDLRDTAKKEAIICGDELREGDHEIRIYNHHQKIVRWKGILSLWRG